MNIEEGKEKRFFSQDLDLVLVIHKKKRERKFPLFPIRRLFSFVVPPLSNPNPIHQLSTHPILGWDLRSGVLFKD